MLKKVCTLFFALCMVVGFIVGTSESNSITLDASIIGLGLMLNGCLGLKSSNCKFFK